MTDATLSPLDDLRPGLGPWATGWLMLAAALSVYGIAANLAVLADGAVQARIALPRFDPLAAAVLAALAALHGSGALALLMARRRAGFFVMAAAAVAACMVNLRIGVGAGPALAGLAGPLVCWLLLRPRWARLR